MKYKIKDMKQVAVRVVRWIIAAFIIFLLIMLVIIEQKQLEILEEERVINILKDDRSCKLLASQQLQEAESIATKQKQEITDQMKSDFYNQTYLACIEYNGRDSTLFQNTQAEIETEKEKPKTEEQE